MEPTGSELRSCLGAIEQRMAALESQMTLLRKERKEVLEDLAAVVYPILTLPSDITSEIFLQHSGHTPNVEVLIFVAMGPPPLPITFPPLVLHHLHTINMGAGYSPWLLDYLILPSLDHANFSSDSECAERAEPLIARSGCSPRTLRLCVHEVDVPEMRTCISSLPSVRDLEMTCLGRASNDFSMIFITLSEHPSFLRALESFVDHYQTNIELFPLVRMLVQYHDTADFEQQDADIEIALDQLCSLRSDGLKLEIQFSIKWFNTNINSQMVKEIGADSHS
ncbi:hypothetical protein C8R44DRAFT_868963 [Mycena epipterygia]|nr:hypothetical protein C8R44DRAFT_868963 [Mycena epipterygia]